MLLFGKKSYAVKVVYAVAVGPIAPEFHRRIHHQAVRHVVTSKPIRIPKYNETHMKCNYFFYIFKYFQKTDRETGNIHI